MDKTEEEVVVAAVAVTTIAVAWEVRMVVLKAIPWVEEAAYWTAAAAEEVQASAAQMN